jgi:hypothetical protein
MFKALPPIAIINSLHLVELFSSLSPDAELEIGVKITLVDELGDSLGTHCLK